MYSVTYNTGERVRMYINEAGLMNYDKSLCASVHTRRHVSAEVFLFRIVVTIVRNMTFNYASDSALNR